MRSVGTANSGVPMNTTRAIAYLAKYKPSLTQMQTQSAKILLTITIGKPKILATEPPRCPSRRRPNLLSPRRNLMIANRMPATDVNDNDRLMAALAYFLTPIVPIIIFLVESMKSRPYQRYHAMQALGLGVIVIILSLI